VLHLAVTAAKLCGPGGVRAEIAENLVVKQQLMASCDNSADVVPANNLVRADAVELAGGER